MTDTDVLEDFEDAVPDRPHTGPHEWDVDPPTVDDMREWRDQLRGEFSNLLRDQQLEKGVYLQAFEVEAPYGKHKVKTGSAPSDADAAIDSIVPPDIGIKVRPRRKTQKQRDIADKLVLIGKSILETWRAKRPDPFRMVTSDMVIQRVGVARVLFDNRLWPDAPDDLKDADQDSDDWLDWEASHRRRFPVVLDVRDPTKTWWREHDGDMVAVVESYKASVIEVQRTLGHFPEALRLVREKEAWETVEVDDVWFGKYRCILVENEPIYPGSGVLLHGYPLPPYVVSPFRELHFEDPSERFRSMLTNSADLYQMESQVLTMSVWLLAWNAWRTWTGWTQDGRDVEVVPGQFLRIDHRKGEYIEMLEGTTIPPELLQMAATFDTYIQRNGVAQGPRTAEGTRSAQQLWAVQAMRELKIESAKASLTFFVQKALALAAMIVETMIDGPISLPVPGRDSEGEELGEVRFSAKDIDGYWDAFKVNFGQRLDPSLLEQWKALSALANDNWMPWRVSVEKSGATDNPQEWEDQMLLEKTDRLPAIIELTAIERAIATYGEDDYRVQMLLQKFAEETTQSGPGGLPGQSSSGGAPSARGAPGGGDVGNTLAQMASGRKASARPRGKGGGQQRPAGPATGGRG